MPIHPRTTAPTTDGSRRTGTGADGGTARGAGAVRPDTPTPAPAARGTFRDDQADASCALGAEGVTSDALPASPARHDDNGTATNHPLRIPRNTRHSKLPRSTTAPAAVADADLNPGATLRDVRAGGRRALGVEGVTRGNPAVAAPLLLKVA
ncbi:hypothetical protein ACWCQS_02790 [Streptomyces sp. NPDC002076]